MKRKKTSRDRDVEGVCVPNHCGCVFDYFECLYWIHLYVLCVYVCAGVLWWQTALESTKRYALNTVAHINFVWDEKSGLCRSVYARAICNVRRLQWLDDATAISYWYLMAHCISYYFLLNFKRFPFLTITFLLFLAFPPHLLPVCLLLLDSLLNVLTLVWCRNQNIATWIRCKCYKIRSSQICSSPIWILVGVCVWVRIRVWVSLARL